MDSEDEDKPRREFNTTPKVRSPNGSNGSAPGGADVFCRDPCSRPDFIAKPNAPSHVAAVEAVIGSRLPTGKQLARMARRVLRRPQPIRQRLGSTSSRPVAPAQPVRPLRA